MPRKGRLHSCWHALRYKEEPSADAGNNCKEIETDGIRSRQTNLCVMMMDALGIYRHSNNKGQWNKNTRRHEKEGTTGAEKFHYTVDVMASTLTNCLFYGWRTFCPPYSTQAIYLGGKKSVEQTFTGNRMKGSAHISRLLMLQSYIHLYSTWMRMSGRKSGFLLISSFPKQP